MSDGWFRFAMGEFEAAFPQDRRYATNHMWASEAADHGLRFGFTAYAVRLLQDVYFLDWIVEPDQTLTHRKTIGSVESKKAESDLFAPVSGTLRTINEATLDDPSLINADPYGDGWLFEVQPDREQANKLLLQPDDYAQHLNEAWEVAQRTIKGQANG